MMLDAADLLCAAVLIVCTKRHLAFNDVLLIVGLTSCSDQFRGGGGGLGLLTPCVSVGGGCFVCAHFVCVCISLWDVQLHANTERFQGLVPLWSHLCPLSVQLGGGLGWVGLDSPDLKNATDPSR